MRTTRHGHRGPLTPRERIAGILSRLENSLKDCQAPLVHVREGIEALEVAGKLAPMQTHILHELTHLEHLAGVGVRMELEALAGQLTRELLGPP